MPGIYRIRQVLTPVTRTIVTLPFEAEQIRAIGQAGSASWIPLLAGAPFDRRRV